MSQKVKISVAITVIIIGVLLLAGANLRNNMLYYYTVDEYLAQQGELSDRYVQVKGYVVPDSLSFKASTLDLRFTLEEGGRTLPVYYNGLKQDTLTDEVQPATGRGIEVVASGSLGPDGVFQAKQLIVKCPSKYTETGSDNKAAGAGR